MLFFSQVCLLAAVAGILAFRHPGPGLTLLALVWLLDLPRAKRPGRILLLILAFAGAFAYAGLRTPQAPPIPAWLAENAAPTQIRNGKEQAPKPLRVRARVVSATPLYGNRLRLILEQTAPAGDPSGEAESIVAASPGAPAATPYQGRIAWTWHRPEIFPLPGQTIEAALRLSPMRGTKNPGAWDIDQYWRDRNVWFRAWSGAKAGVVVVEPDAPDPPADGNHTAALARTRQKLLDGFVAALPGYAKQAGAVRPDALSEGAAMLPALIFDDRSFISAEQTDLVARSTLAHSLSLSGLHLAYPALAGLVLAHALGRCFPGLWLRVSRPLAAILLALPLAGIYLWLGGMPLPLMRAACMMLFWALLLLLKRPKALLDGLLAAVAVLLLLDPLSLFDLSFQLSALSVAAIALCLPPLSALAHRLFPDQPLIPGPAGALRPLPTPAGALFKTSPETSPDPPRQFSATGERYGPAGLRTFFATTGSAKPSPAPAFRRFMRWAVTLLGMSFCIQLALMPLTVRAFGLAALCFPLNLIWVPAMGALVMPPAFAGLLFSGLGLELPAKAALYLASLPCEALMEALRFLDKAGLLLAPLMPRPHWLSIAGFWVLCLTVPGLVLSRDGTRRDAALLALAGLGMLLLPPGLAAHADTRPGVSLRLLDVGQGQAVLVEWSGLTGPGPGKSSGRVLVDGGGFAGSTFDVGKSIVAPVLTDNARPRLDLVVNTHPDADHLAGLIYILEHFTIGQYLTNGDRATPALEKREQAALDKNGLIRCRISAGDSFDLAPGLRLDALWPEKTPQGRARSPGEEKGNDASIVLRLVWREKGLALLCGDAEGPALRALLDGLRKAPGANADTPGTGREKPGEKRKKPDTGRLPAASGLSTDPSAGTSGQSAKKERPDGPLTARILVLPHHGSARSLVPGFYEAVRPELALASCGYANKWGFPSAQVRSVLRELNVALHDTAKSGQIRVEWRDPNDPATVSLARTDEDAAIRADESEGARAGEGAGERISENLKHQSAITNLGYTTLEKFSPTGSSQLDNPAAKEHIRSIRRVQKAADELWSCGDAGAWERIEPVVAQCITLASSPKEAFRLKKMSTLEQSYVSSTCAGSFLALQHIRNDETRAKASKYLSANIDKFIILLLDPHIMASSIVGEHVYECRPEITRPRSIEIIAEYYINTIGSPYNNNCFDMLELRANNAGTIYYRGKQISP